MSFERVEIGPHVLFRGACEEVLPTIEPADAVITDPPFGVGNFVQVTGDVRGDEVTWNDSIPSQEVFDLIRQKGKHRIIWGANFFNCFEPNGGAIVWFKHQTLPNFSKCDIASSSHLKKTEVVNIPWSGFMANKHTDHPCERPVGLYTWCINYLPKTESVIDPFMGSGSCGVACERLGIKFTGIEREPKYFDIACRRIEDAMNAEPLLAGVG